MGGRATVDVIDEAAARTVLFMRCRASRVLDDAAKFIA